MLLRCCCYVSRRQFSEGAELSVHHADDPSVWLPQLLHQPAHLHRHEQKVPQVLQEDPRGLYLLPSDTQVCVRACVRACVLVCA